MPTLLHQKIRAFWIGIKECNSGYITNFSWALSKYYEKGRRVGHLLTFKWYEI